MVGPQFAPCGPLTASAFGAIDGSAIIFCGAQALGMADLGNPEWVEEEFDYGNQSGVSVSKILGYKKPVFYSQYEKTTEDFGIMNVYVGGA